MRCSKIFMTCTSENCPEIKVKFIVLLKYLTKFYKKVFVPTQYIDKYLVTILQIMVLLNLNFMPFYATKNLCLAICQY